LTVRDPVPGERRAGDAPPGPAARLRALIVRRYVVERLIDTGLTCVAISFVVFAFLHLAGDPAKVLLPPEASKEAVSDLRRALGLDDPFLVQYGRFLGKALRGEFGESFIIRDQALGILLERAPATLELAVAGLVVGLAIAIPLGIVAGYRPRTWVDHVASAASVVGQAVPTFWLGIMLILLFAVALRVVPVSGRSGPRSLILPAVCLGVYLAPLMMRLVRSGMLGVLTQDYVRTARAKGIAETAILWKHAFKNVSIPLVTMIGLQFGRLLAGTVVIETIFAWPGIGFLTVKAVRTLDYPVVQASVVVVGAAVALVNLVTDVVVGYLDPRIRYG
jgi:peptide/nickel transport system permease protein